VTAGAVSRIRPELKALSVQGLQGLLEVAGVHGPGRWNGAQRHRINSRAHQGGRATGALCDADGMDTSPQPRVMKARGGGRLIAGRTPLQRSANAGITLTSIEHLGATERHQATSGARLSFGINNLDAIDLGGRGGIP